jgi:hypothetical protein
MSTHSGMLGDKRSGGNSGADRLHGRRVVHLSAQHHCVSGNAGAGHCRAGFDSVQPASLMGDWLDTLLGGNEAKRAAPEPAAAPRDVRCVWIQTRAAN